MDILVQGAFIGYIVCSTRRAQWIVGGDGWAYDIGLEVLITSKVRIARIFSSVFLRTLAYV